MTQLFVSPRLTWAGMSEAADFMYNVNSEYPLEEGDYIRLGTSEGGWRSHVAKWPGVPNFNRAIVRAGNGTIVFCGGVKNQAGARQVLDGYADRAYGGGGNGNVRNSLFVLQAELIKAELFALQGVFLNHYTLVGHSAGGAIMCELAYLLKTEDQSRTVQVVTFGSPRPFGELLPPRMNDTQITRIMHELDPVPYIPYGVAELLGTLNVYGVFRTSRFSYFRQCGVGLICNSTEYLRVGDVPEAASDRLRSSFDAYVAGTVAEVELVHSMGAYRDMVRAIANTEVAPTAPTPRTMPVEPAVDNPRARVRQAQAAVSDALRTASELSLGRVPSIPEEYRYRVYREGGVYVVYQGNAIISLTGHKGQAKACARQGNQFVSELLRQPFVHQDGIIEGIGSTVAAAQDDPAAFGLQRLGDVDEVDAA